MPAFQDQIVSQLRESISDAVLSKAERKSIRALIPAGPIDQDQLNFLRSKVFELAGEKITDQNYRLILDWVKETCSTLSARPQEKSEALFSPGDVCRLAIIRQIDQAQTRIRICVFTISDDLIADAVVNAHRRGVDIRILTDNDKSFDLGSDIARLAREGVVIKMDNTANHMHHKFMVVDDQTLVNGSYNWTRSAARFNHENIILSQEPGLVRMFLKEYDKLWNELTAYVLPAEQIS